MRRVSILRSASLTRLRAAVQERFKAPLSVMGHLRLQPTDSVNRRDYVVDRCRGKSVLHLGCVDSPFLAERLASGELLHDELRGVASLLCGVDLDGAGLQTLRERGFEHLYQGNIETLSEIPLPQQFEVVLAAEIMEHLANPGMFLRGVPARLAPGGTLVVTVPSATSARLVANALRSREVVHPDHNAYYSPNTLTHLLETHGFVVEDLRPYWADPRTGWSVFSLYDHAFRLARRVRPWLGDGIVVTARLRH